MQTIVYTKRADIWGGIMTGVIAARVRMKASLFRWFYVPCGVHNVPGTCMSFVNMRGA